MKNLETRNTRPGRFSGRARSTAKEVLRENQSREILRGAYKGLGDPLP